MGGKKGVGFFEYLSVKSIYDSSDNDEEVGVVVIPHVVFDNRRRGIGVNRGQGSVHDGLEVGGGGHNWVS
jgi:hypothetical protein